MTREADISQTVPVSDHAREPDHTREAGALCWDSQRLSAVVATRLCHDLAGPVGALNAGIELLADETDAAFITETVALLRHSAEAAAARLKLLRLAFGVVTAGATGAGDLHGVVRGFVAATGSPVELDWGLDPAQAVSDPQAQGILLLCLAGLDCLRQGGSLRVSAAVSAGGALTVSVVIQGRKVALEAGEEAVLQGDFSAITPRTAALGSLAVLTGKTGGLRCDGGIDLLRITATLTANEDCNAAMR